MKRIVAIAILGSAACSVLAQGHVSISNYLTPPYNQVRWDASAGALSGQLVQASANVQLQVLYGPTGGNLEPGVVFGISPTDPGYFLNLIQVIPTWAPGSSWDFQIVASGDAEAAFGPLSIYTGQTPIWTETARVTSTAGAPLQASVVPELLVGVAIIPEPSTFALAGLGAAALLIFRRRQ